MHSADNVSATGVLPVYQCLDTDILPQTTAQAEQICVSIYVNL